MLSHERERWQRDRESQATTMEREKSQHIAETALLQEYISVLIGKIRGQRMHMPLAPTIPSKDPPIPSKDPPIQRISPSTCQFLQVLLAVGDLPLFQIGHKALHQDRLHFKLWDRFQALQPGEPVLLPIQLLMMMSMIVMSNALLMTLSKMMIQISHCCCTIMMMWPLRGHVYLSMYLLDIASW